MHVPHIHMHKISWHEAGVHIGHWIHDPRFWGILGLIILFVLMALTLALTKPATSSTTSPIIPRYPYAPF